MAYESQNGLARAFQQLTRMRLDYAVRWRAANEPRIALLADILQGERPELKPDKARFLAHALVTMVMSQLDLTYVYRGPERGPAKPVREDVARNLVALWARMTDVVNGLPHECVRPLSESCRHKPVKSRVRSAK